MENTALFNRISALRNYMVPLLITMVMIVMLIPLPTPLLDVLISFNITLSVSVLFLTMYVLNPVEFSVFPTLLLILTLFRLSLNIASTRLILLRGNEGVEAAGKVIMSFGQFVVGGNYVVGLVVFIVIVVVQFVVINHGATRIAEVSARFTLDAMPGKQMAIDADLNSGLISEAEARERREKIQEEASFYGAMDGAVKFTQRDAVASLLITFINIIAGLIIGVFQHNMDLAQAAQTFTILTIGDGLVSAIPSLFISVGSGLLVTRSVSKGTLGDDVAEQFSFDHRPLGIASAILFLFALVPGLPTISFMVISGIFGFLSYQMKKTKELKAIEEENKRKREQEALPPAPERVESLLKVDILGIEFGYGLIPIVDPKQGGTLLDRVKAIRRQLALELGLIVPPIRIRDNLQLAPNQYSILIKGNQVALNDVVLDHFLAMNPGTAIEEIEGIPTKEPAFGLDAYWIHQSKKDKAQMSGYTVVDIQTVITTHLTELIKKYASLILGRQETQNLLDNLAESYPKLVEDVVPAIATLGTVQKVLHNLLNEGIPIRDLVTIMESIAEHGVHIKDVGLLTENVRNDLKLLISNLYASPDGTIDVMVLDPNFEQELLSYVIINQEGIPSFAINTDRARYLIDAVKGKIEEASLGSNPVLLVQTQLRLHLSNLLRPFISNLSVIAHNELIQDVNLNVKGVIK